MGELLRRPPTPSSRSPICTRTRPISRIRKDSRRARRDGRGLARGRRRSAKIDDFPAIGRSRDQRAAVLLVDDHAGLMARTRADVQGADRSARHTKSRPTDFSAIRCCSCATSRSFAVNTCRSAATRSRISSSVARSFGASTTSMATGTRSSSSRRRRSRSFPKFPAPTDAR